MAMLTRLVRLLAPRLVSLRFRLIVLVAATVLPLLGFGLVGIYFDYQSDRTRISQQELALARSMAQTLGGELEKVIASLQTLTLDPSLQAGDFERFRPLAEGFTTQDSNDGRGLAVTNRNGEVLFHASSPSTERPLRRAVPELSARVFDSGQPSVSNLVTGDQGAKIAFDVPVRRNGRVVFGLTYWVSPEPFAVLLANQFIRRTWVVSIYDGAGTAIARIPNGDLFLGKQASPDFYHWLKSQAEGVRSTHALEGTPVLTAWSHVEPFGWSVGIGIPEREITAPARHSALVTLLIGGAVLLAGLLAAALLARDITGPISSLARVAEAAEGEGRIIAHRTGLLEVDEVADALREAAIRRRIAERASQQSGDLARRLIDTTPSAIMHVAPSGAILYANPAAETLLGMPRAEIMRLGLDPTCWSKYGHNGQPIPQDERPARRALRGETVAGIELVLARSGGISRVVLANATPILEPGGGIAGALLMLTDVSDRFQAETALRELVGTLEQRIAREVAAREAAQAQALHAQKMQALGQLAGGIAHDINNVLQSVLGALELIMKRTDAPGVRRLANLAIDAAERGGGVVRRLLAFARRGELRGEPIDSGSLVAGLTEMLVHALDPNIALRTELVHALPAVVADRTQLETVLLNLANNARDAMPSGGILTIRVVPEVLEASSAVAEGVSLSAGSYLRFEVTDTGMGMDAATLARAGEPFFTTKPIDQGTGLGLAMARGFAEQSGGALSLTSAPGQGTTVRLWLPCAEQPAQRSVRLPTTPRIADNHAGPRVLLVDDEPLVRDVLSKQLEDSGCVVLDAPDADSALVALEAGEPDVLVSDLAMPGMNGLDLIREARRRRPRLPAVLLTGYAGDAVHYAAASGVPDERFTLMRKPVSGEQLADGIAVLLAAEPG
jgi:PAS domain S-box-containing protein